MTKYRTHPKYPDYLIGDNGSVISFKNGKRKVLKLAVGKTHGYLVVELSNGSRKSRKLCLVHRLVLETFVGPCPPGMKTRHFPNQDKTDNRLVNLSWGTQSENEQDKKVHGTFYIRPKLKGESNPNCKLTVEDVLSIRYARKFHRIKIKDLARLFGISTEGTKSIIRGVNWKHLPI